MTAPLVIQFHGPDGLYARLQHRFALEGVCFGHTPIRKREELGRWHADARVEHREVVDGRLVVTKTGERRVIGYWRTVGALATVARAMGLIPRGAVVVERAPSPSGPA